MFFISTLFFLLIPFLLDPLEWSLFHEQAHTNSEVWREHSQKGTFCYKVVFSDELVLCYCVYQLDKFHEAQEIMFAAFLDDQM